MNNVKLINFTTQRQRTFFWNIQTTKSYPERNITPYLFTKICFKFLYTKKTPILVIYYQSSIKILGAKSITGSI